MSDTPTLPLANRWNSLIRADMENLERELAAANERIRRLEEAGDAFVAAESVEQYVWAEENWTKAKEAKP